MVMMMMILAMSIPLLLMMMMMVITEHGRSVIEGRFLMSKHKRLSLTVSVLVILQKFFCLSAIYDVCVWASIFHSTFIDCANELE